MHPKQYNDRHKEATRLGFSVRKLDRACKDEGFPYIRFGGRVLFDPELTDEYLARRTFRGRAHELAQQLAQQAA